VSRGLGAHKHAAERGAVIGIAEGPVVEREGRYFGAALNLTARLAARAACDEILCTAEVARACGQVDGVDPVCRMHLEPDTAPARLPFGDTTYYFCSLACARTFAQAPENYQANS